MLNVSPKIVSDVANRIDTTEKIVILVDSIDWVIGEIITRQEHNAFARETQIRRDQLAQMKK